VREVQEAARPTHLTVRLCAEGVRRSELVLELLVVVDLAVDAERHRSVGSQERLLSRGHIDDRETFVRQDRAARSAAVCASSELLHVDAAPVGTTMTNDLAVLEDLPGERRRVSSEPKGIAGMGCVE